MSRINLIRYACFIVLALLLFSGCTSLSWIPKEEYNGRSKVTEIVTQDFGVYHVHDLSSVTINIDSSGARMLHMDHVLVDVPISEVHSYQVKKIDIGKTLFNIFSAIIDLLYWF